MNSEQTKLVLLIDDDPVNNVINTRLISMYSPFTVIVFTDAHEALQQLKNWPMSELPEVIFLDINMPEMNGWAFLEEFQALPEVHEKCRVVMLTSSIDFRDIRKSKTYPVVRDFISKPLTLEKLREL